jgi:uncharacterized protein
MEDRAMTILPQDLVDEPLTLDARFEPGAIEYTPDIRQTGPLQVDGRAELIVEHRGPREFVDDIRLRAHFGGEFELQCARCLEAVAQRLEGDFDLIFRPADVDAEGGEHAITEDETEIGYYETSGLLLEDAVREQVLLALPGRTLCQEDCQGLCPQCGANRNRGDCGCVQPVADGRWKALADFAAPKA